MQLPREGRRWDGNRQKSWHQQNDDHVQRTAKVETPFVNPRLPHRYRMTMLAGVATDTVAINRFPKVTLPDVRDFRNFRKRRHNFLPPFPLAKVYCRPCPTKTAACEAGGYPVPQVLSVQR